MNEPKQSIQDTGIGNSTVYLIRPRLGGLANDTAISLEKGTVLYHVKSKVFSPMGRQYGVYDNKMEELLRTEQDNTTLFPRHTVIMKEKSVGKLGQAGIIPQRYFAELSGMPRAEVHLGAASPIFALKTEDNIVLADIAQHRSVWIVIIPSAKDPFLILACLAIIYRESTIAGC